LSKNVDNGATEAEAMAAISKAKDLMKLYYISESDLGSIDRDNCVHVTVEKKTKYKAYAWTNQLAKMFDCRNWGSGNYIHFFGMSKDIDICEYFFHYIENAMITSVYNFKKSEVYRSRTQNGRTLVSSYVKGFSSGVFSKLRDINRKNHVSSNVSALDALVLSKSREVNNKLKDKLEELYGKNVTIRSNRSRSRASNRASWSQGLNSGSRLSLNKGVRNSSGSRLIG
jgi:hypothetical protein